MAVDPDKLLDPQTNQEFRLGVEAPQGSADRAVMARLFQLRRGDIESKEFPFPPVEALVGNSTWARVLRVSSFWAPPEPDGSLARMLEETMSTFVAALHGHQTSWQLLLRGHAAGIEVWFGARSLDQDSLESLLKACFADVRLSEERDKRPAGVGRLPNAFLLSGTPSRDPAARGASPGGSYQRIETVCRGLYGQEWAYLVHSVPWTKQQASHLLANLLIELSEAQQAYIPRSQSSENTSPPAKRLLALLELRLRRYQEAQTSGLWGVQTWFLTLKESMLKRAEGLLTSAFGGEFSLPDPIRASRCSLTLFQRPFLESLNSAELAVMACLPREEHAGYAIVDPVRFGVAAPLLKKGEANVKIGSIIDRGEETGTALRVPLADFAKHALIVGVTGSGKTNTCFRILEELWAQEIPFLVIESAKSEYRSLLASSRFLRKPESAPLTIFTIGEENISPLRLNPFEVPAGFPVLTHIDYLKSLFSAAFVLYPPMPYVLEQSIQEIYEDRGWDLIRNKNRRGELGEGRFPSLRDLHAKIDAVITRMGYDERITMDIRAGLLARINQLRIGGKGPMLNARRSVSSETLFKTSCILELKQLVSDDEKAFLIGLVLIRLQEFREVEGPPKDNALQHVTLIEEAHRLLRNVSTESGSEISANPKGKAIEVFSNILSEIRSYGEGILIAEQVPVKLTPDAIKNTNLKIIHRLVAEDDRRLVGSSIGLAESEHRRLASLDSGVALAYAERMEKPVMLQVALSSAKASDRDKVGPAEMIAKMDPFWLDHESLKHPYSSCFRCHGTSQNRPCQEQEAASEDAGLQLAFRRLLNALRLGQEYVVPAYWEFIFTLRRVFTAHGSEVPAYCIFISLLEPEIERRGAAGGWPHDTVERIVGLASFIFARIGECLGDQPDNEADPDSIAPIQLRLSDLYHLFRKLCVTDDFPFPGCRSCLFRCDYRYDMSRHSLVSGGRLSGVKIPPGSTREMQAGTRTSSELIDEAKRASASAFIAEDRKSTLRASLCFAVQYFSKFEISTARQIELAREFDKALRG
jgi:hypothetical protein